MTQTPWPAQLLVIIVKIIVDGQLIARTAQPEWQPGPIGIVSQTEWRIVDIIDLLLLVLLIIVIVIVVWYWYWPIYYYCYYWWLLLLLLDPLLMILDSYIVMIWHYELLCIVNCGYCYYCVVIDCYCWCDLVIVIIIDIID